MAEAGERGHRRCSESCLTISDSLVTFQVDPPPGVSHVSGNTDAGRELKNAVMARMADAPWNRYVDIRSFDAEPRLGSVLGLDSHGLGVRILRGGEEALLELAVEKNTRRLLVPQGSYPGYGRVARALRLLVDRYESSAQISDVDTEDPSCAIILTVPGNPDGASRLEDVPRLRGRGAVVVIDAAFAPFFSGTFAETIAACAHPGVVGLFSLSKTLPFAGVRLGGVIARRETLDSWQSVPNRWDLFQCAVLEYLLVGNRLLGLASEEESGQAALHAAIRDALRDLDREVVYADNPSFVTVRDRGPTPLPGGLGLKHFSKLGLDRVDATWMNAEALGVADSAFSPRAGRGHR